MSTFNLSNVKVIGFIPNFDPKKGYPEFGNHVLPSKRVINTVSTVEPTPIPKWKKNKRKRLKRAKLEFSKTPNAHRKPVLLVSTKLA